MLSIHESIKEKLTYFQSIHKIPNIIFHGPSGSGKRTLVNEFIHQIYEHNKDKIKNLVMNVNCAHGKGIKFIRDELKFFAKTHIHSNGGDLFKTILLLNADKLTMDAQSALRRCIELFSHNTRFFIIVEDKYKLLKPILSRFCEIYIPEPIINGSNINLYKYNIQQTFNLKEFKQQRMEYLKKYIQKTCLHKKNIQISQLIEFSNHLYEKSYTGLDIMNLIENTKFFDAILTPSKKYELLIAFNKVRKEFRNEKIFILFILHFLFLDTHISLENFSFM
jgi:replication-associated recombination protein RarA